LTVGQQGTIRCIPNDLREPDELMSVSQVALALGCSAPTIRRWIHEGHLSAHKVGPGRPGLVRIRRSDVDALLGDDDKGAS
jgi:excisionase family DNA binding protein